MSQQTLVKSLIQGWNVIKSKIQSHSTPIAKKNILVSWLWGYYQIIAFVFSGVSWLTIRYCRAFSRHRYYLFTSLFWRGWFDNGTTRREKKRWYYFPTVTYSSTYCAYIFFFIWFILLFFIHSFFYFYTLYKENNVKNMGFRWEKSSTGNKFYLLVYKSTSPTYKLTWTWKQLLQLVNNFKQLKQLVSSHFSYLCIWEGGKAGNPNQVFGDLNT